MKSKDNLRNACPTAQQEQLLRATLKQGKVAIEAWNQWQSHVDMDKLDWGSYRLLPLLYYNLRALGIKHPLMDKFKKIYRQTWGQNQILFHQMKGLLRAFHKAGIQKTLLLKGPALILFHYKDYALRPMTDFDVLIPTEQAFNAIRLLEQWHWLPKPSLEKEVADILGRHQAWTFQNDSGRQFNLHWHLFREDMTADNDFWVNAVPDTVDDVPVYALNPTDQLLQVCVYGAKSNTLSPLPWIADAMIILQTSPEIDWERLLIQTEQRHLILPLRYTLNYLYDRLAAPIPSTILQGLQNLSVSMQESLEYQVTKTSMILFQNHLWFQYESPKPTHSGWWPKFFRVMSDLKWN
jgi:hypothetical protein